jgi:hypothetical protein
MIPTIPAAPGRSPTAKREGTRSSITTPAKPQVHAGRADTTDKEHTKWRPGSNPIV